MSDSGGWVEFNRRFVFVPESKPMTSVVYKAGHRGRVNAETYRKAIAAGAAGAVEEPKDNGRGKASDADQAASPRG
jgi:hypothetical protein